MDSNVLIAGIGVVGTLLGAFIGAWLNPKMQEWQEDKRNKRFLKEATKFEKFIVVQAYRRAFLPLHAMYINTQIQLNNDERKIIGNHNINVDSLKAWVKKLAQERRLFIVEENQRGYFILLNTELTSLINQNKEIRKHLYEQTKETIEEVIYPQYVQLINNDKIFQMIRGKDAPLPNFVSFMNNIGVFSIYGKDLSHLNLNESKAHLEFPKGEFHPEHKA